MRQAVLFLLAVTVATSFVLPLKLTKLATNSSNGEHSEIATFLHNVWTANIQIGTPFKMFTVVIDTTTSFLFVPDKSCGTSGCSGKNLYDSSASSSYVNTGNTYREISMYGTVQGFIAEETIMLGQFTGSSPIVTNATFGQSTSIPGSLPAGIDGVFGLGLPGTGPHGTTPVFQTAINNKQVNAGTFTLWLEDQYATDDNGTEGVIYYGNNDYLHCKANQSQFYPLTSAQQYQFTTQSVSVGAYQYRQRVQTLLTSISPYIAAPAQLVQNILRQLGLPQNSLLPVVVPCDLKIDIAFNFQLGTQHVTELNLVYEENDGTCKLALVESPFDQHGNDNYIELGIPFLRGRCTFFDVAGHRIGFSDPVTHGGHNSTLVA